jgi:sulfur carrier protein
MDVNRNGTGDTVKVNGQPHPLVAPLLEDLLRELGYDPGRRGVAVAVNGEVVRRASWAGHRLRGGDEIDVVGAVQGG